MYSPITAAIPWRPNMKAIIATSPELGEITPGFDEPPRGRWLSQCWALAELELRKLRHDPTELLTRAIQPALWLLVFGQIFARLHAIPTGNVKYIDYLAPGILAQSVLF